MLDEEGTFLSLTAHLTPEERKELIAALGMEAARAIDENFRNWAHDGQKCPDGDWRTWVMMAGRGFGKTRAGAEWLSDQMRQHNGLRIALVGATIDEARRVMVEGESGLVAVAGDILVKWSPSLRQLIFKGDNRATVFSGASPDALRGPEHHFAWCDELAKWEKPQETWDMLQLGMRLGRHPRVLVTTTPRAGTVLSRIIAARQTVVTSGKTRSNPHLPKAYVETVEELYAGTRFGRQELDGELLPDVAGALWTVELIERCRLFSPLPHAGGERSSSVPRIEPKAVLGGPVTMQSSPLARPTPNPSRLREVNYARTVIGVDPPTGDGTCGIVACAVDANGTGYVLADHSVTARSPEGWARAVASAAQVHGAQLVVAETNQGGDMVKAVFRAADVKLRVEAMTAHSSKSARAAPVATAFEAGKVWLCGTFPELEAELCGLIAGGGYEPVWSGGSGRPGKSPDRADAMVWALTNLMPVEEPKVMRIRGL